MKKEVMLILTESCPLACSYCFEHHKSNRTMSFATAKDILDKEAAHLSKEDTLMISLFGGEPLLEYDLIKEIFHYAEASYHDKNIFFFITSNAVLLTEEMKCWFRKHKNRIQMALSIDGKERSHNLNRSGSFARIKPHLDFFAKSWPMQPVQMTVSQATLDYLYDNVIYLHELGFRVNTSFAKGIFWEESDVKKVKLQFEKLADYYISNAVEDINRMFVYDFEYIGASDPSEEYRPCGAGTEKMMAYSCDGTRYPCQCFTPVSLGYEEAGKFANRRIDNSELYEPDRCRSCKYRLLCPSCLGMSYSSNGGFLIRSPQECEMNKLLIETGAKIRVSQLAKKTELNRHDFAELAGIRKIYAE